MKVISEWKKNPRDPAKRIAKGKKRVMAIVEEHGRPQTRHIDIESK